MTGNPDKSLTIDTQHHSLQGGLTQAIVTAYLITGSTGRSEATVMAAIEDWEPNKGVKSLLELVAGLAVKYEGGPRDEWPLRDELQNVAAAQKCSPFLCATDPARRSTGGLHEIT